MGSMSMSKESRHNGLNKRRFFTQQEFVYTTKL
jgi:hypothetical protein